MKSIRKYLLNTAKNSKAKLFFYNEKIQKNKETGFLSKKLCIKMFSVGKKTFLRSFEKKLSLWASFIVEARWRPQPTFLLNVHLISNISLHSWRRCFPLFYFQSCKNPLVSHIFLSFNLTIRMFNFSSRRSPTFLGIIFNT